MTREESKAFFKDLLNLDYSKAKHRATLRNIMKILDVGETYEVAKHVALDWLMQPNFVTAIVSQSQEQSRLPQHTVVTRERKNSLSSQGSSEDAFKGSQELAVPKPPSFEEDEDSQHDPMRATLFEARQSMVQRFEDDVPEWRIKLQEYLIGDTHYVIVTTLIMVCLILFGYLQVLLQEDRNIAGIQRVVWTSCCFNFLFLIELLLHFVAFDAKFVVTRIRILWLEAILQIMSITAFALVIGSDAQDWQDGIDLICTVFLFRTFRVVVLIQEIQQFDLIFSTAGRFSLPFLTMCLSLYTIYYTFANMGMLLFGGRVRYNSAQVEHPTEIPNLFYMMNFNDFPAALVTLFHIMVVNNWYVTANMYYYVMGNTAWPILFFMLFWVMTVLIMLNLVIAFVLDIYSQVSAEIAIEYQRRENVHKQMVKFSGRIAEELEGNAKSVRKMSLDDTLKVEEIDTTAVHFKGLDTRTDN